MVSPSSSGRSSVNEASTSGRLVKQLPMPDNPSSSGFEQRVHLLVGIGAAGPACIVGGATEGDRANASDGHGGREWLVVSVQWLVWNCLLAVAACDLL